MELMSTKFMHSIVGIIMLLACFAPRVGAQCNNTGRQVQVKAGGTGQLFSTCTSVTFSVAGQSMSTPSQCESGNAYYHGTVYACQGQVNCANCKNEGYPVTVDRFTGGGCPDTSELMQFIGGSWSDWSTVPEALKKALSCTKPTNNPTFDWSASVSDCPDCGHGEDPENVSGEAYVGGDGSLYIYWDDLLGEYPTAAGDPRNLFLSLPELAEVADPVQVGGYFQRAAEDSGLLTGASIGASVSIRHFDDAGLVASRVDYDLQGKFTDNGRFDVIVSWVVDKEDGVGPISFSRRETFDGRVLSSVDAQAEVGNAFERTAANMIGLLEPVRPAFEWVHDPYSLPMHQGIELSFVVGDRGELIQRRSHEGTAGEYIGSEYEYAELDGAVRPIRTSTYLPDGSLFEERRFEDFRKIRGTSNCVRPSVITHVYYTGGFESQKRSEVILRVRSSRELSAGESEAVPAQYSDRQPWLIWQ
jgi:hypothetical protein